LRTTASLEGPEFALDASAVLAHSPATSIRYYVKAQASRAVERHGLHLAKLRRTTAPLAASVFGWRGAKAAANCALDENNEASDQREVNPGSEDGLFGSASLQSVESR
jgi:hypothetical protein